jgi:broad specificity phosphatase PhoE
MNKRTTLILVRHGETEANVSQVWHGALDAPLTERGRQQVAATAAYFAQAVRTERIDRLYVSPLARAQSTAAAIADATGLTPIVEPGLREFSIGDWEGRTMQDLRETENLWGRWAEDPWFTPPNGESPGTFNRRVVDAMRSLAAQHPGETLLLVTHSGVIATLLASWIGSGREDWVRFTPDNCSVSRIVGCDDTWEPLEVNSIAHLVW